MSAFNMPSFQGNLEPSSSQEKDMANPTPATDGDHEMSAATSLDPGRSECTANELSTAELRTVAGGAMDYLKLREPTYYVHHLVTAMLCLGLAPRSQVLKQLQLGSTFSKEADGRYWVKMAAEQSKNGKPTVFALPTELTEHIDYYLQNLRPQLLQSKGQTHDYVFFKRNGTAPRADFSDLTTVATQQLIGRPVNPHAFRSAVITSFYASGATQSEMNVLASIMAHDPATARNYYFKPQMSQAAIETSERMKTLLQLDDPTDASMHPTAAASEAQESF